jgi:hypothetical protein
MLAMALGAALALAFAGGAGAGGLSLAVTDKLRYSLPFWLIFSQADSQYSLPSIVMRPDQSRQLVLSCGYL